ncbi:MAG TPA: hypothetical protein VFF91_09280, partial [Pseudoxanthomonas sp.]|nr:hypothetical protein [Pseudoxanthomonas sp.]
MDTTLPALAGAGVRAAVFFRVAAALPAAARAGGLDGPRVAAAFTAGAAAFVGFALRDGLPGLLARAGAATVAFGAAA